MVVGLLAIMLLVACSSGDDDGDAGASTGSAAAAPTVVAPVPNAQPVVAQLVIGSGNPVSRSTFNPWKSESPRGPWFFATTHESLIGADPITGEHIPRLATSWTIEPDGRSVRFKLRQGVRFHGDNGEFGAKDLVATLAMHTVEDAQHSHRTQYRAVDIEVVNANEVVYHVSKTNPEILNNTSSWNLISGEPFSAESLEKMGGDPDAVQKSPAGTGPYQFAEGVHSTFYKVERVPYDHWRYNPDWEGIEFRWIDEQSTRLAGILTGEIHLTDIAPDLIAEAINGGKATSTAKVLTRERTIMFEGALIDKSYGNYKAQGTACGYAHCDSPLLDIKVRQALNKAIDRAQINEAFFLGKGIEVHNHAFVPTRTYWNPDWDAKFQEQYGYDPVAAKALLAEAGYGPNNPLELRIDVAPAGGLPEKPDLMESAAAFWNDIGIKTNLDNRDRAATNPVTRSFGFSQRISYMSSNIVDMQTFRVHHCSCQSPRGGFELKELDKAIAFHREVVDSTEVYNRLRETGNATFDLFIAVPLFWQPQQLVYDPEVIASYEFSGVPLGVVAHFDQILAVKK
jgi:ABC-type transport system substrate-binding protein